MTSVSSSPDGTKVASGSGDKTVKLWDVTSGACLQTLEGHSKKVNSVSFSPDGTKVASGSYDNTVKLWDVTSGECLQTLEGHSNWVWSVSFSPDGTKVASQDCSGTVKIWNPSTGECTFTGDALPNPEEFPEMGSKARPDVNGYVGFQNCELLLKDDSAVAREINSVHILKLVC